MNKMKEKTDYYEMLLENHFVPYTSKNRDEVYMPVIITIWVIAIVISFAISFKNATILVLVIPFILLAFSLKSLGEYKFDKKVLIQKHIIPLLTEQTRKKADDKGSVRKKPIKNNKQKRNKNNFKNKK